MRVYTVGVDLGIAKIAWAIHDGEKITGTGALNSGVGHRGEQIYRAVDYLDALVDELCQSHYGEDVAINVFIEEPLIGNNRKYSMQIAQVYGAVLAQLAYHSMEGVRDSRYPWVSVYGVNVGTWKKQVLGNGHADKEEIKNYIRVTYDGYADLCGHDQDRYDAACVCLYGVLVAARADTLATQARESS